MSLRAQEARQAWAALRDGAVQPLGSGLINDTFSVSGAHGRWVLQRVNPIFGPEVQEDIAAVTERLARSGLPTPRLLPTDDGALCLRRDGEVWRVLTFIEGTTFDQVQDADQARAAGGLLARFHSALADLDHVFRSTRVGVHDTPAHLTRLREAVARGVGHRLYDQVVAVAEPLLEAADALPRPDPVPERVVHGDPKLNNMLFAGPRPPASHHAVCMVDLDTCARMALHLELGDAWRSWCNRSGEDTESATFDLDVLRQAWDGYREACTLALEAAELRALVHGVEWITLELAARFLADALLERYFGWDRSRYPAAGEHNLVRARGQWSLHLAVVDCRDERARILLG